MRKGRGGALLAVFVVVLLCELKAAEPSQRDYKVSWRAGHVDKKISPPPRNNDLVQHERQHGLFSIISAFVPPGRRTNNRAHGAAGGITSTCPRDRGRYDQDSGNYFPWRRWRASETRRGKTAFLSSPAVGAARIVRMKRQHVDTDPTIFLPSASSHRSCWRASSVSSSGGVVSNGQFALSRERQRGRNNLVVGGVGHGDRGEYVRPEVPPWRHKAVIIPG